MPIDVLEEANRIKGRLRAAGSVEEIEAIADEERATVKEMAKDIGGAALALQVAHLKQVRLFDLQRGEGAG